MLLRRLVFSLSSLNSLSSMSKGERKAEVSVVERHEESKNEYGGRRGMTEE